MDVLCNGADAGGGGGERDESTSNDATVGVQDAPGFDFVLGADVFYHEPAFEDALATASYVMGTALPRRCVFLVAFHERCSATRLDALLLKWGLHATQVPLESFCDVDGLSRAVTPVEEGAAAHVGGASFANVQLMRIEHERCDGGSGGNFQAAAAATAAAATLKASKLTEKAYQ